jgi:hypothetical protein
VSLLKKGGIDIIKPNNDKQKSYIFGSILTIFVVLMLLMLGTAQGVTVSITGLDKEINKVRFQVTIEIKSPDEDVPIQDVSVELSGPESASMNFDAYGVIISGDQFISIDSMGMGNEDGKDAGKIVYKYNIEIDTKDMEPGTYTCYANLNTGKSKTYSAAPVTFTI